MDGIDLKLSEVSQDSNCRLQMIRNLISNHKGDLSIDLFLDIFQNLILDCKSITQCNTNKYLNNIYQIYESLNDNLYHLRVKSDDFNMLKVIGQGAFGQVQLVRHRDTGHLYAMKILNKTQMKSQEGSVFWKEERDIMAKINSRWIVKLHYAFQDPRRLYMVMEYMPGGNLVTWMAKLDDVFEADVSFYTAEIVLAVSTLHQHNFVHRDIKPDNMLLDIRGHIKLADFGSCVRVDPLSKYVTCNRAVGTPDYISPEVLLSQSNNTRYGCEVDWWALGVMLYEIFYGDPPFYSDTLITTYGKIMTHEQSLTFPPEDQVSGVAISLMKGLICDRSVRLGVSEVANDIKSHRFFTSPNYHWNWENIHDFDAPYVPKLQNDWDTSHFEFNGTEEGEDSFNNDDVKELGSKVFAGENLQFSGFSYSDIFNECLPNQSIDEHVMPEDTKNSVAERQQLANKLQTINKENQDIKSTLERISIEKENLEAQLQTAAAKCKHEEGVSKKLQMDCSDLMTKHGLCQQKILKMDEEKHKLCADLVNLQRDSTDEIRRLLSQIETQRQEFNVLNSQLSESQTEYRKSKLQAVKLESDLKYLQKRYDSLQTESSQQRLLNDTSKVPLKRHISNERVSLELKELRVDYEESSKNLQNQIMENQALSKSVTDLQKEKEQLRLSMIKIEDGLTKEIESTKSLNGVLKEKNLVIENMKAETEQYKKKLEVSSKIEKEMSQKHARLMHAKSDEKQRHDNESEEQRKKFNSIITNKSAEIHQLKKSAETLTDENGSLRNEVQMEKAKCLVLVDKINEIITGKSTSAREMMIGEDMKSGLLGKRSGRYYNQVMKENKKLQSMLDQLGKDSSRKEKELRTNVDNLMKEKDSLETEIAILKSNIEYYENIGMTDETTNRTSRITISSQNSSDSGLPLEGTKTSSTPSRGIRPTSKPPLLNLSGIHGSPINFESQLSRSSIADKDNGKSEILRHESKTKVFDNRRVSISETVSSNFNCPEGQLDVNVKVKGKKMSWEKRYVKIDGNSLLFYDPSLDRCFLKLPLCSLVLVRRAKDADIIHAKKGEIPRIFQIFYDKNRTLYSELIMKQNLSGSSSSINTVGSGKSTESTDTTAYDLSLKQGSRKSSVAKFFGSKSKSKTSRPELRLNSVNSDAVFLKGHVFQTCAMDARASCDICKKSLTTVSAGKERHVVVDTSVRMMMTSSRDVDVLSSTVDGTKTYRCFHCGLHVHGAELDEKMIACEESVAIQLCRASSEEQLDDWIKCLSVVLKSQQQQQGATSAGPSRGDYKARCSTLS